jgi:hypothetical protein
VFASKCIASRIAVASTGANSSRGYNDSQIRREPRFATVDVVAARRASLRKLTPHEILIPGVVWGLMMIFYRAAISAAH